MTHTERLEAACAEAIADLPQRQQAAVWNYVNHLRDQKHQLYTEMIEVCDRAEGAKRWADVNVMNG